MAELGGGATRRTFLKAITTAIAGVVGAVLAVPWVRAFVYPSGRRIVSGSNEMVRVARAADVGVQPLRVEITAAEQRDAWAKRTNVRLGAAWLVRDAGGQIRAFSTTCPHLGCAVDWDADKQTFRCPCHTSAFAARTGERLAGPAKRGLDPLETRTDEEGEVHVRFARFRPDTPGREKI